MVLNVVASKVTDNPVVPAELEGSPFPIFGVSEMSSSAVVWDGQTVAMARRFDGKKVVVFVTPTLIDPAGNRVYPETEP